MWLTPYFFKFLCVAIMEFTFESFKEELQSANCLKPYQEYVKFLKKV